MSATLPELVADAVFMGLDLDGVGRQDCEAIATAALGAIRAQGWRIVKFSPEYHGHPVPMFDPDGDEVLTEEWTG